MSAPRLPRHIGTAAGEYGDPQPLLSGLGAVLAQQYGDQAAQNESDIGAIIRGRAAANDRTREGALNMALQGGAPIDVARMRGALAVETPSQTSEANKLAAIVSPAPVPGSAAVPGTESTPPMPDFNIPASDVYNPDTAGPSRDQISQEALRNRAAAWTPAPDAPPDGMTADQARAWRIAHPPKGPSNIEKLPSDWKVMTGAEMGADRALATLPQNNREGIDTHLAGQLVAEAYFGLHPNEYPEHQESASFISELASEHPDMNEAADWIRNKVMRGAMYRDAKPVTRGLINKLAKRIDDPRFWQVWKSTRLVLPEEPLK
jgi:hypothetical protein